jgi:hypothetical protein
MFTDDLMPISHLKPFLFACLLSAGFSKVHAQAQPTTNRLPEVPQASYRGRLFPRLRTAIPTLPWAGQAEILRLETLLQRAYLALLTDSTATVLLPVQADVVEQAARQAAAVVPTWNHEAYRQEAAFYVAEQARRFPATKKP